MARALFSTMAALVFCSAGVAFAAPPASLSIHECRERQSCDGAGSCVTARTRVFVAQLDGMAAGPYFSIGPLVPEARGGLFFEQDWRWSLGGLPAPSAEIGRAQMLSSDEQGHWTAHVYRPGREVPGLHRSDWVRADYTCQQVMF
ncbi:hypothetical protein [Salipiger abyssi]|uniref:hypothetical protein n=1 Tax=Salipiger abyssi TaxID=1250539 RepID=UPI001A8F5739|nr:hypothetical protein [Salipiger abyssi]MBN9886430.1 hypothetical protein [Salipiger abyssi]